MYHAGVVKLTQRLSDGFLFQGSYTYSKLMTNADAFSGSTGAMDTAQPELEYSIGRFDQTHSIKLNTVFELPFGSGKRWLTSGIGEPCAGWMADCRGPELRQRSSDRRDDQRAAADFQRHESSERDRRRLARADCRRRVQSARRPVPQQRRVRAAGRAAGQRAAHQRRCAAILEPVGERQPREDRSR